MNIRRAGADDAEAIARPVLWGWALAQFPYVVPPDLTFAATAAPPSVLRAVLGALLAGSFVLVPSLAYLYRVFKSSRDA